MEHEMEYGIQPLDTLMTENGLDNHAIVAASTEQLTHKMVAKARRGHWLSLKIRMKILRAYNKATQNTLALNALFTYA